MYPVDLPDLDHADFTPSSQCVESGLLPKEKSVMPHNSKVTGSTPNVSRLQLFDEHPACAVLALHSSDNPAEVVALYLHNKWWSLEDVLRTSSSTRNGLVQVHSLTERLIVFLLSQVVEQSSEGEPLFARHPSTESCKVLWREGRAVGFYSIKHKGSLLNSWSSSCYLLPVLDTVLVRQSCRQRGFGLQMLEDFCSSFSVDETIGVSAPISASMAAVLRRFLQQHEEHRERLYEVEAPGGWAQRRNIWLNIQLGRYSLTPSGRDPEF